MECAIIFTIIISIGILGVGLLCAAGPLHGAAPRKLGGPGHTSDGAFLPAKILSKTIDFERPGGREWLPSGTPFQKKYSFFGRVFGPARVRISYVFSLRSGLFLQRQKMCTKDPNVRISYRSSLRRGAQTSFLTLFSEGFSDPRV